MTKVHKPGNQSGYDSSVGFEASWPKMVAKFGPSFLICVLLFAALSVSGCIKQNGVNSSKKSAASLPVESSVVGTWTSSGTLNGYLMTVTFYNDGTVSYYLGNDDTEVENAGYTWSFGSNEDKKTLQLTNAGLQETQVYYITFADNNFSLEHLSSDSGEGSNIFYFLPDGQYTKQGSPEANDNSSQNNSSLQGQGDKSLAAIVNGARITETQLDAAVSRMKKQNPQAFTSDSGVPMTQVRSSMLDELINEQLIEQEAKAHGVAITDGQVNQQLNEIKKQYSSQELFNMHLQQQGYTLDTLKSQLYYQLAHQAIAQLLVPDDSSSSKITINEKRDEVMQTLLTSLRKNAKITIYDKDISNAR